MLVSSGAKSGGLITSGDERGVSLPPVSRDVVRILKGLPIQMGEMGLQAEGEMEVGMQGIGDLFSATFRRGLRVPFWVPEVNILMPDPEKAGDGATDLRREDSRTDEIQPCQLKRSTKVIYKGIAYSRVAKPDHSPPSTNVPENRKSGLSDGSTVSASLYQKEEAPPPLEKIPPAPRLGTLSLGQDQRHRDYDPKITSPPLSDDSGDLPSSDIRAASEGLQTPDCDGDPQCPIDTSPAYSSFSLDCLCALKSIDFSQRTTPSEVCLPSDDPILDILNPLDGLSLDTLPVDEPPSGSLPPPPCAARFPVPSPTTTEGPRKKLPQKKGSKWFPFKPKKAASSPAPMKSSSQEPTTPSQGVLQGLGCQASDEAGKLFKENQKQGRSANPCALRPDDIDLSDCAAFNKVSPCSDTGPLSAENGGGLYHASLRKLFQKRRPLCQQVLINNLVASCYSSRPVSDSMKPFPSSPKPRLAISTLGRFLDLPHPGTGRSPASMKGARSGTFPQYTARPNASPTPRRRSLSLACARTRTGYSISTLAISTLPTAETLYPTLPSPPSFSSDLRNLGSAIADVGEKGDNHSSDSNEDDVPLAPFARMKGQFADKDFELRLIDEINSEIETKVEKKVKSNNKRKAMHEESRKKKLQKKFKKWRKIQEIKRDFLVKGSSAVA